MLGKRIIGRSVAMLALFVSLDQAFALSNAAPLGLEIGVATCDAARAKLVEAEESPLGQDIWLESMNVDELYPGATKVSVRCSGDRVIAVQIEASKGGMGNSASQQAYATLVNKYKRIAGGSMPTLGNGYARFVAGNSVIEQSAPHLSFEFTVTYYEKNFYDNIQASNVAEKKSKDNKQESAL